MTNNITIQQNHNNRHYRLVIIVSAAMLAVFIGLTQLTTIAYAWQLDVDLSRSTFGSDRVCAAVHGPYGYDKTYCTESGQNAGVSFNIPEDEVPDGYNYRVCAWGGVISSFLQNCQTFTHDSGGDESVWIPVGR